MRVPFVGMPVLYFPAGNEREQLGGGDQLLSGTIAYVHTPDRVNLSLLLPNGDRRAWCGVLLVQVGGAIPPDGSSYCFAHPAFPFPDNVVLGTDASGLAPTGTPQNPLPATPEMKAALEAGKDEKIVGSVGYEKPVGGDEPGRIPAEQPEPGKAAVAS